ncbi:tetratricopeptide repeat protein [Azospirillum griseum]|uniref:protein O-GlcNAc transferase n=1 Tax=Azospirillum griseum TaxID=2496639 RepID=A0A3S0K736_9PROT|nr:tetratricopeptide repeat protein [Azospirillum griseum]RTR22984.1 hypothetical protein EJ903_05275 [Azospirillum griseum]
MATIAEALGVALDHHMGGRLDAAETLYRRILDADPGQADALHLLGVLAGQTGRADRGADLIRQAMAQRPDAADYPSNLGALLDAAGQPAAAAAACRRALALRPDFAVAWARLGGAAHRMGAADAALDALRRAASLDPADRDSAGRAALLLRRRAVALREGGRLDAAFDALRRAVTLDPGSADGWLDAAQLAHRLGDRAAALAGFRAALALAPAQPDGWGARAALLDEGGESAAALAASRRALIADPTLTAAWINRGAAFLGRGRHAAAAQSARRALALNPTAAAALCNLATALRSLGAVTAGVPLLRRGQRLGSYDAERGLLSAILYDPTLTEEARYAEALAFARRRAPAGLPAVPTFRNDPAPDRRLRIGYLSADLRDHPVARNIAPILANHDRAAVEVALYATDPRTDAMTERLRGFADLWRPVAGLGDAAIAERIRADGVDALVTLAGRFDANRPLVAAHRPAPVLISAHDGGTSGLPGMDALFTDRVLAPRSGAERFRERPFRLPGFYAFDPMTDAPPPHPVGHGADRPLTFGSLNNPAKVNDAVLTLWARVLRAVPGSRLLLRYRDQFLEPLLRDHVVAVLAGCGVAADRLVFPDGAADRRHHLAVYHEIDIALDTHPFSGATTSFEALWMGVPVVTLCGDSMMGRVSAAHLRAAGAAELIAGDADGFVAIAADLAADPQRRAAYHAGLRARLAAAPLMNGPLRARQFERACRALWRRWLKHR